MVTLLLQSRIPFQQRVSIATSVGEALDERKKLKRLWYYYVLDSSKEVDLEERQKINALFGNYAINAAAIVSLDIAAFYSVLQHFLGRLPGFVSLIYIYTYIALVFFLYLWGFVIRSVYKHTVITYTLTPFVSAVVYEFVSWLFLPQMTNLPNFVKVAIWLGITIILYALLSHYFPVYILRRLSGRKVLLSALVSVVAFFVSQMIQFFWEGYLTGQTQVFNFENVQKVAGISSLIKK